MQMTKRRNLPTYLSIRFRVMRKKKESSSSSSSALRASLSVVVRSFVLEGVDLSG